MDVHGASASRRPFGVPRQNRGFSAPRSARNRTRQATTTFLSDEGFDRDSNVIALLRSEAQNAPAVDDGLRCVFTAPEKPGVGLHPDGLTAEQLAKLTNTVRGYAEHSSGGRATRVQISVLMVGAVRQDIPERVFHAPPEPPSGGAEDMATTMPPEAP